MRDKLGGVGRDVEHTRGQVGQVCACGVCIVQGPAAAPPPCRACWLACHGPPPPPPHTLHTPCTCTCSPLVAGARGGPGPGGGAGRGGRQPAPRQPRECRLPEHALVHGWVVAWWSMGPWAGACGQLVRAAAGLLRRSVAGPTIAPLPSTVVPPTHTLAPSLPPPTHPPTTAGHLCAVQGGQRADGGLPGHPLQGRAH